VIKRRDGVRSSSSRYYHKEKEKMEEKKKKVAQLGQSISSASLRARGKEGEYKGEGGGTSS